MNLNLIARLAALERRHPPPAGPFCVQIMVLHDGTTVLVCYPLPVAHTDRLTLAAYRARVSTTCSSSPQAVTAARCTNVGGAVPTFGRKRLSAPTSSASPAAKPER